MTAPCGWIRVRLLFANIAGFPRHMPLKCWFLVDTKNFESISDVEEEISTRFGLHDYVKLQLFIDDCLLPSWGDIRLLRDGDEIRIRDVNCGGRKENMLPYDSPANELHQTTQKATSRPANARAATIYSNGDASLLAAASELNNSLPTIVNCVEAGNNVEQPTIPQMSVAETNVRKRPRSRGSSLSCSDSASIAVSFVMGNELPYAVRNAAETVASLQRVNNASLMDVADAEEGPKEKMLKSEETTSVPEFPKAKKKKRKRNKNKNKTQSLDSVLQNNETNDPQLINDRPLNPVCATQGKEKHPPMVSNGGHIHFGSDDDNDDEGLTVHSSVGENDTNIPVSNVVQSSAEETSLIEKGSLGESCSIPTSPRVTAEHSVQSHTATEIQQSCTSQQQQQLCVQTSSKTQPWAKNETRTKKAKNNKFSGVQVFSRQKMKKAGNYAINFDDKLCDTLATASKSGVSDVESAKVTKDYEGMPPLHGPPNIGSVIAYKEGRVIEYQPFSNTIVLECLTQIEVKREPGRFDITIEDEEEILTNSATHDIKVSLSWSSLVEPRLVSST